jgi:hypothetical protein
MSFTDAQKVDIRRFCGYPAYGGTPSGFQSWRFFQVYGLLEYRMNNLSSTEETAVETIYLANLYPLELAIANSGQGATDNMDTDSAGPWVHNKNEVRDRSRLFDMWCRRLCGFFDIPPGPALGDGSARIVI